MDLWELAARESIRDTISAYAHYGDRMMIEELAQQFTEDGVLEIKGREPAVGRAAIVAMLGGGATSSEQARQAAKAARSPGERYYLRHNVSSVRIESVSRDQARVGSYFLVVSPIGPDHWGRYRDLLVPVGQRWLFQHRFVSVDGHAPGSRFGASIV
jgi:SnoaL-like protein